ncbi:SCP-2 sterol transfer family protein [Rhodobacteraceae bacterium THAF1]|uniref:SCP2 sterol-binding domain-containing protein n=1 Tax=Palleronia sp. THAF1 TaxID=2587842 RepID=UPI000F3F0265|nr:SCP2 sterol-binding domain-containing protein [Palleronia sp. THAF1]QFU10179.1 SCP-2 sterol transfer family protein [Palleronia sp. THAF1]VDC16916.1 SCP-2 sterol transfer family protein [Rhodobacteraceae bacterium THAF1]
MTMTELRDRIQKGLNKRPLDASIQFDCGDEGAITLIGDTAYLEDRPADCTLHISRPDLERLLSGKLNPMTAFATRRIKVSGDMKAALKLAQVLK